MFLQESGLFCDSGILPYFSQGSEAHKPEANVVVPVRWGIVVPIG